MNELLIPSEFKSLRQRCGFSQAKIANDLGFNRSYLSQFENGRYQFDECELAKIRDYLEDNISQIVIPAELEDEPEVELSSSSFEHDQRIDDALARLQELLATPVPKVLFVFDDDEGIEALKDEILTETLTIAKAIAESLGIPLNGWREEGTIAHRIIL